MAYKPKLSDLPQEEYRPNLQDIPKQPIAMNQFNPSFIEKLAPNVLTGLTELGENVLNIPSNIARHYAEKELITPEMAAMVPRKEHYPTAEALGLPQTPADKFLQGILAKFPQYFSPAPKLGALGSLAEKIPLAGKFIPGEYLAGVTGRVGTQAGLGGALSENPEEGAKHAATTQGIIEAVLSPFHAAKGVANAVTQTPFVQKTLSNIRDVYSNTVGKQREAYALPMERYGEDIITKNPTSIFGKDSKYLYPTAKKLFEDFKENATVKNLQKLQAQIGRDEARTSGNPSTIEQAQRFSIMKDKSRDMIKNHLGKDIAAQESYQKGIDITRDLVKPFEANKTLEKIAKGKITDISAKELANHIKKGTEKLIGAIPEKHYLINALNELNKRTSRGSAIESLVPPVAQSFSPQFIRFMQEPYIRNMIENMSPYLHGAGRTVLNYNRTNEKY